MCKIMQVTDIQGTDDIYCTLDHMKYWGPYKVKANFCVRIIFKGLKMYSMILTQENVVLFDIPKDLISCN